MKKLTAIVAFLLIVGNALAGTFRVHFNVRGSARDITVQAESSAEARRTVMDMFPGSVVTGVHRVQASPKGAADRPRFAVAPQGRTGLAASQRSFLGLSQEVTGRSDRANFIPSAEQQREFATEVNTALSGMPGVLAARAVDTIGMYKDSVERSLDVEVLAGLGFDPWSMLKILARQAGQKDQDSAFVSRVMVADEQSSNARPGMEIYFKAPVNVERMKPVMDFLSANGINGFTMIADPSMNRKPGEFLGMRFQYIPEYTVDRNPGEPLKREQWAKEAAEIEDILIDAARQLGTITDVASADLVHYDTLVLERQHDYDSSGLIEGSTGQARGQAWTERFHGAAAAAANRGRRALGARSDPQVYRGGETLPTRAGVATQGVAQGRAGLAASQPMGFLRARSVAAQMLGITLLLFRV